MATVSTAFLLLLVIVALVTILKTLYTVRTATAGVVERFGKFDRITRPGLHVLVPFAERVFFVDLQVKQAQFSVETKTRDNVFVQIPVSVQYQVLDDKIFDAFYKLSRRRSRSRAFVFNSILGHVPKLTLDETFEQQSGISVAVKVRAGQHHVGVRLQHPDGAGDGHHPRREGEGGDERHQRGAAGAGGGAGAGRGGEDSEGEAGGGRGGVEGAAGQGDRGGAAGDHRWSAVFDRALSRGGEGGDERTM